MQRSIKRESIAQFFTDLQKQEGLLAEFDEELWYATVDALTVRSECEVTVTGIEFASWLIIKRT